MAEQSPKEFALFFCEMVDTHRNQLQHFLAEDAALDWFGRAVIGRESIINFLASEWPYTKHSISSVQVIGPIQHRIMADDEDFTAALGSHDAAPMADVTNQNGEDNGNVTPEMKIPRPWDNEAADSLAALSLEATETRNICFAPKAARCRSRWYFDNGEQNQAGGTLMPLPQEPAAYLEAFGLLEFTSRDSSPSSAKTMKRYAGFRSKKERNCKLKLGYTKMFTSVQISMIIYYDSMSCRKKLAFAAD